MRPKAQDLIVVHLDVNGTIMAADKAQNKTTQDYVKIEFAKHVRGVWRPDLPEMTYREFVENHVIPGNGAIRDIKDARNNNYKNFVTSSYLQNHPEYAELTTKYKEYVRIAESMDNSLFPSFWRLVEWAKDKPNVRLVFRTFGHDISDIREILNLKGYVMTNILAYDLEGCLMSGETEVAPSQMWQDLFNAVHDNHKRWHENGETEAYAKPFMQPENGVAIVFDDNAKVKHIIAPDQGTRDDLITSGHIVPVRTLMALTDPEYFVSRVEALLTTESE
jgi:hypothetical protein